MVTKTEGNKVKLVRGYFTAELKKRCDEFVKTEGVVPSLNALLEVSAEFYLESFQRSGKLVKGRFPIMSAVGNLEVTTRARDGTDDGKHRVNERRT